MRLVTYTFRGVTRTGALISDSEVIDLNRANRRRLDPAATETERRLADAVVPTTMRALLEGGNESMHAARNALEWARGEVSGDRDSALDSGLLFETTERGFKIEAPVPDPNSVFAVGVNYADHREETGRVGEEYPTIFIKASSCIIGPGEPVLRPKVSTHLDYEGELVVVIGKAARHVTLENAWDYVAGYMNGNDVSVRDYQRHTAQNAMGKSFDTSGPIGPWLVTADEVDATNLELKTTLNGEVVQHSNTSKLITDIPHMLEYMSRAFTLRPGDLIFTGTCAGVGHSRKPPLWMKHGDTVRVEFTGLGVLENPIIDEV